MRLGTRLAQFCLLILCLTVTVMAYQAVRNVTQQRADEAFAALVSDSRDALADRMKAGGQTLRALAGLFSASEEVTRADFANFVHRLSAHELGSKDAGLAYIRPVKRSELDQFIAGLSSVGVDALVPHPETRGEEMFLVQYFEASRAVEEVIGLDLTFEEERRETAIAARDSGLPHMTSALDLAYGEDGAQGYLLYEPIYQPDMPLDTPEQRRAAFSGWVSAMFLAPTLLSDLTHSQDLQFGMRVYEGQEASPDSLIYASDAPGAQRDEAMFKTYMPFEVFGRSWTVEWYSTPRFEAGKKSVTALIVLGGGLMLSLLISGLFFLASWREAIISRQVRQKTSELKTSEEENRAIVENAMVGIITLDESGLIMSCNPTGAAFLGEDKAMLVGRDIAKLLPEVSLAETEGKTVVDGDLGEQNRRIYQYRLGTWKTATGHRRRSLFLQDVTDEENLHKKVGDTERRLNLALKGAEIGVFDIDVRTGKSVVSDSWRRLMGVSLDDPELDTQAVFNARVHPEDFAALKASDLACIKGETARSVSEFRVDFGEDGWRWMRSEATVVDWDPAGHALRFVGAQVDVTEERLAQIAVRNSEERFRLIFSNAPVGVCVLNNNAGFTESNAALCDYLGYSEEELTSGKQLYNVMSEEDLADILTGIDMRKQFGYGAFETECELVRKDGSKFWAMLNVSWTVEEHTGEEVFIAQVNDITDKKHMERIKSEFVATVSHELRTPLTSLRGALALLDNALGQDVSPVGRRMMTIAQSNSDRLIALVNDILDIERIESGRMQFNYSHEVVTGVLSEITQQMMPYANDLGVELNVTPCEEVVGLWTDRARLLQVFANLLSNACKFSKRGGTVSLEVVPEKNMVRFLVRDNGPGIPDSFRSNIFKPFSQADSTDTREKGGTGLGLSICKQLVERMGGEIGYTSDPGRETVFWFTVRRQDDEDEAYDFARSRASAGM